MKRKLLTVAILLLSAASFAQVWTRGGIGSLTAYMDVADVSTYKVGTVESNAVYYVPMGKLPAKAKITDIDVYTITGFGANTPKDSVTIGTLSDGDFVMTFLSTSSEGIGNPSWNTTTDGHAYSFVNGTGIDLYLIYWKATAWPTAGKVVANVTYTVK